MSFKIWREKLYVSTNNKGFSSFSLLKKKKLFPQETFMTYIAFGNLYQPVPFNNNMTAMYFFVSFF